MAHAEKVRKYAGSRLQSEIDDMKAGDLVRWQFGGCTKKIGLLVEYNTWEKVARILYKGKIISLRAENVEKAGKKDFEDLN